jgi:hypothetical protein
LDENNVYGVLEETEKNRKKKRRAGMKASATFKAMTPVNAGLYT